MRVHVEEQPAILLGCPPRVVCILMPPPPPPSLNGDREVERINTAFTKSQKITFNSGCYKGLRLLPAISPYQHLSHIVVITLCGSFPIHSSPCAVSIKTHQNKCFKINQHLLNKQTAGFKSTVVYKKKKQEQKNKKK